MAHTVYSPLLHSSLGVGLSLMLVRLAGVELTPEGKEWLQKNLAPAQTVWLKLISREEDVLHCLVCHSRVRHQINETKERYCCLSVTLVYFLNDRCGSLHVSPVADMAVAVNYSNYLARVRYFLQQGLIDTNHLHKHPCKTEPTHFDTGTHREDICLSAGRCVLPLFSTAQEQPWKMTKRA